jgi:hypothetical protein
MIVTCVETCLISKCHITLDKKLCIKGEINYKFQIQCGTELAPYITMGSLQLSGCVTMVLYMEYVAPAAIKAHGHVIVIYIPLGWLFFLKGMTPPFTHALMFLPNPVHFTKKLSVFRK